MADPKDVEATKIVRREFTRRNVDTTMADIRVSHGVAYVKGTLRMQRGGDGGDIKATVDGIAKALRTRTEIRDVVIDASLRT